MRALVVGGGGREHALALSLRLSDRVESVHCCPGNPGIAHIAQCSPISTDDFERLAEYVVSNRIDLTVVGSEEPLTAGIVDFFEARNLRIFGPRRDAAKLEWSKYFAKEFMLRRGIPTAKYAAFDRREYALAYAQSRRPPIVIKADGLARGKGVTVAQSYEAAQGAIDACFDGKYGEAGRLVIVEDFIPGREASVFAICNGTDYALLPTAMDYKRLLDGDRGPNTGGMGACAPHPQLSSEVLRTVEERIIRPTLNGMCEEGRPYRGFLYVGLMIDQHENPYVIEFNCRLGDPEAQVILPLVECDFFDAMWSATDGTLSRYGGFLPSAQLSGEASAICVVLCSQGYPEKIATSMPVRFQIKLKVSSLSQIIDTSGEVDPQIAKVLLYHSATNYDSNRNLVTAGGRVFGVTALAQNLSIARRSVYTVVKKIDFAGKQHRNDIGLL